MIQLLITNPSAPERTVDHPSHILVAGKILHDEAIPDDARLTVLLSDARGKLLRHVSQDQKNNRNLFMKHPLLTTYPEEDDPGREELLKFGFPELMVEDLSDPYRTLKKATIKAFYSDDVFKALIVSGTDRRHGMVFDDGIGYLDENGEPYQALEKGDYRIQASLRRSDGSLLAETAETIHVIDRQDQVICRFNPIRHKKRMIRWAKQRGFTLNADTVPGYLEPYLGKWKYHMGLLPMYRADDIGKYVHSHVHAFVYLIDPTSTSYETELAYLQSQGILKDPDRFTAYHYDIGEALIGKGRDYEQEAEIKPFTDEECLHVCRVDLITGQAEENRYQLDEHQVLHSWLNPKEITLNDGDRIAIMSVVKPLPMDAEDFVLTKENIYRIGNDIDTLLFEFHSEEDFFTCERKLGMERFDPEPIGSSVYEAYNLFDIRSDMQGRTYQVTITAFDTRHRKTKAQSSIRIRIRS